MSGRADEQSELLKIVQGLRSHAKDLGEEGPRDWPRGKRTPQSPKPQVAEAAGRFRTEPSLEAHTDLPSLHAAIKDCLKCPLGKTRIKFVFGEGDPHAKLMFIGEGPGRDEDLQGRPFVGRAGQLLTKIIEAMGLKRQDVYIANVIKCRPPNNRPPEPMEIEKCWPHLTAQIRLIKPKVICALGSSAARTVLGMDVPISALRGRFHEVDGIPVMPTYHPAYLLRNPNDKGKVWDDMKKVRDYLKGI